MPRRRRISGNAIEVPMSSMIDVVFLLLIYFIVTYKEEIPEPHLAVNLPAPSPPPPQENVEPPTLLCIEVQPGEYYLRGRSMSLERIGSILNNMANQDADLTVVIKVNQRARTRNLVRILDLCQGAGLKNMNVVTLE